MCGGLAVAGCNRTAATLAASSPPATAGPAQTFVTGPGAKPGIIPGAPAGSPEQVPDSTGYPYGTLFHELSPDNPAGFVRIFDGQR
jgi:hypothetical protein